MPVKNAATTKAAVASAMDRGRTLLAMGGRLTRWVGDAGAAGGRTAAGSGVLETVGATGAEGMTARAGGAGNGACVSDIPLSWG